MSEHQDSLSGQDLKRTARQAREIADEARDFVAESRRPGDKSQDTAFDLPPAIKRADELRAEDDERTAEDQIRAAEAQRDAAERLRHNAEELRETREDIRGVREQLRDIAQDVHALAREAQAMREQTVRIQEDVRSTPPSPAATDRADETK